MARDKKEKTYDPAVLNMFIDNSGKIAKLKVVHTDEQGESHWAEFALFGRKNKSYPFGSADLGDKDNKYWEDQGKFSGVESNLVALQEIIESVLG